MELGWRVGPLLHPRFLGAAFAPSFIASWGFEFKGESLWGPLCYMPLLETGINLGSASPVSESSPDQLGHGTTDIEMLC